LKSSAGRVLECRVARNVQTIAALEREALDDRTSIG
jgi:hypothetical protein